MKNSYKTTNMKYFKLRKCFLKINKAVWLLKSDVFKCSSSIYTPFLFLFKLKRFNLYLNLLKMFSLDKTLFNQIYVLELEINASEEEP
jgi:hypothetical protein